MAASTPGPTSTGQQILAVPPDQASTIASLQQQITDLQRRVGTLDAPVYAKYRQYEIASYDEKIRLLDHRVKMYNEQSYSGAWMMWLSFLVVIVGLGLSTSQLIHSARIGNKETLQKESGSIDISLTGIKITTSVTGMLILAMSLGFTYLFIDRVYTVHEINITAGHEPIKMSDSQNKVPER